MTPAQRLAADALKNGFAALNRGDAKAAAEWCRKAIAADRANPEAHFLVGLVASDMQDWRTAASAFGSVTKIKPGHAAAWAQLARVFMRLGQPARAEKALAEAKAAGSGDPAVEDLIGVVSSLLGDQVAAVKHYGNAWAKAPERAGYGVNLASAQIFLGETEAAEATLSSLLARHPNTAQAEWMQSSLRKAEDRARADALMEKAARAPDAPSKAFFAYAAGKDYEDCACWGEAFAAFELGGKAKRSTLQFDEAGEEAMFAALRDTFNAEWASQSQTGHDDPSPIFVIGQPRTGTTLIERIITSHSMAESAGELQQFGLSVRRLAADGAAPRGSPEAVRASASVDAGALGKEYLRASAPMRKGAPRFVDKLPVNYQHVPLILAALPNARIVHLVRDPMDSCFASYKQLFAEAYFHSYDQLEMARHHIRYARLMDHWRALFPGRFLDISYEETVADLEPHARRLIDFLGLPWEDQCLSFHEQTGAVATASAVQVREKAHTRSVGRWRRYERELQPMRTVLAGAGLAAAQD
ncbi:MAG: sulfotransferase [Parvularculaceae bacterium]